MVNAREFFCFMRVRACVLVQVLLYIIRTVGSLCSWNESFTIITYIKYCIVHQVRGIKDEGEKPAE